MNEAQRDTFRKKRVLEHADRIGNVRKACRYFGVSKSPFYLWRKAYEVHGGREMTPGEFKQHLAFEAIPTQDGVTNAGSSSERSATTWHGPSSCA